MINTRLEIGSTYRRLAWHPDEVDPMPLLQIRSYRLAWHPEDPTLIVTGGCDYHAVITSITEKCAKRSYRHPNIVIGVAFNPHASHLLCTACQDCFVRIWDTNVFPHHHTPLIKLANHQQKVFNVAWHPFYRNLLASGSDDTTIRVWNIDQGQECQRLMGHRAFVRALCWHHEVMQILLSGSWDASTCSSDLVEVDLFRSRHLDLLVTDTLR